MNLKDIDAAKFYTLNEFRGLIPSRGRDRRVSLNAVYRWIIDRKLTAIKAGGRWLVTGAAILEFLRVEDEAFVYETKAQGEERGRTAAAQLKALWKTEEGKRAKPRQPV